MEIGLLVVNRLDSGAARTSYFVQVRSNSRPGLFDFHIPFDTNGGGICDAFAVIPVMGNGRYKGWRLVSILHMESRNRARLGTRLAIHLKAVVPRP